MDIGIVPAARTLESRFSDLDQPILLTGVQALVRVLLEQSRLDRVAALNTGGFVSGYRGSPLGGLDQELWRRATLLDAAGVRFQPGLNEDLAATMVWGTQQVDAFPDARVQGVFGMWYGKGPGVDRSADALRCANHIGTSRHGGVLAVSGDDHGAHSSVFPHQTDQVFEAVMIPVLQPADVGEIVSLGLAGIAMSRFSGLWSALKLTAETAEQGGTCLVPSARSWQTPEFAVPPHGLNLDSHLAWPARRFELERRVLEERLPAVLAWARANHLDRLVAGNARAEIGIVAVGKAWEDVRHALRRLGIEGAPWLAAYKVALTWPIETEGLRAFARGKRALIVVEEKRSRVEAQLRDALYNLAADERPMIVGKQDLAGAPLLPAVMELSPEIVAPAFARMLASLGYAVEETPFPAPPARPEGLIARAPMFCAGCPHNTSTVVPAGSHAMAGIGCHTMAITTSDVTRTFSHMGGEGVPWLGLAPFSAMPHMFANMGDGTYQHSGLLAIRQAVAAKGRITYKLLFNDAVAMTGGQPAEGAPTPVAIAWQVAAEGVELIALVVDEAARLPPASALPPGTLRHTREDLDAVQKRLREFPGVSVLIYDQVCATEKRRRRKRGKMAAADRVVTINERVCENCGDCTAQSNCIAIEPVETEYGRKRRISPTSCNTDLSCLKGFCPSFVTAPASVRAEPVESPWLMREAELAAGLPEPALPSAHRPWRGLFAGIGGGGIVTAGAVVAMAAHLEGRQVATLDFTGLAQKNGAVVSHIQIADPDAGGDVLDVVRIPTGEADLMLAADLAVAVGAGVLERCRADAAVVGNLDVQAGAGFLTGRDLRVDAGLHRRVIERQTGAARSRYLHAAALSERLFGNAQVLNTVLLGMAWQMGLMPVGQPALMRAFELNGTAVALNRRAFLWGRLLADDPTLAGSILHEQQADEGLDGLVERRAAELVAYRDERLAARYRALVARAAEREAAVAGQPGALARAVAEGYFRVLAYKDEYEVARLHAAAGLAPGARVHLSPPLPLGSDPATGRRRKIAVPGWAALPLFRTLRHGKRLRGTALDPFGRQADRRAERQMIADYEADLGRVLGGLRADQVADAAALARLPLDVRGFGPIKVASAQEAQAKRETLLSQLGKPSPSALAAE